MIRLSDALLVLLIVALLSAWGGYSVGRDQGRRACEAARDSAAVKDLSTLITTAQGLVAASNDASRALREQLGLRAAADEKTTRDLRNALAKSAAGRAGCRYDDDSVRHVQSARERAAQAAAGGVGRAVPAAGRDPGQ